MLTDGQNINANHTTASNCDDIGKTLANAIHEGQKIEKKAEKACAGVGSSDFLSLVKSKYYVDKSQFLLHLLGDATHNVSGDGAAVTLITRPRRYGKTSNMSMLYYFLSKFIEGKRNSTREVFKKSKLGGRRSIFESHYAKYIVINLTLKDISFGNVKSLVAKIAHLMSETYKKFTYLVKENKNISFGDNEKQQVEKDFTTIVEKKGDANDVAVSLKKLIE